MIKNEIKGLNIFIININETRQPMKEIRQTTQKKMFLFLNRINLIYSHLNNNSKENIINCFLEIGNEIFNAHFSMLVTQNQKKKIKRFYKEEQYLINPNLTDTTLSKVFNEIEKKKNTITKRNLIKDDEYNTLITPIKKRDGKVYGFLIFFSKNTFNQNDKTLSALLSSHMHTALKNKKQIHEFKLLNSVSKNLTETQDLNDTLKLILTSVSQIFRSNYVHILKLIDKYKNNDYLEVIATSDNNIKTGTFFRSNEGFSGWIISNNKFLLVPFLKDKIMSYSGVTENDEKVNVTPKSLKLDENEKCFLGVPLRYKNLPIGVLVIANTNEYNAYDVKHDQVLLQMFADQAAVTIENLNTIQEEKNRHEEILKQATLTNPSAIAMSFVHDARHSMSNINAYFSSLLNYISKQRKLEPGFKTLKETLINESDKLKTLFKSLVRYARKDQLNLEFHQLKAILDHIYFLMSIRLKTIKCNINYLPRNIEDISIYCDRAEIEQLLINLFNNSIAAITEKSNTRKGLIEISISEYSDSQIKINFFDNGIGIQKEELPLVFDLFYTTKKEGTGFGLPICKRIIEDHHNGSIKVKSEYGENTCFEIILPKTQK